MRMTNFRHGCDSARQPLFSGSWVLPRRRSCSLSPPSARADVTWNVQSGDWSSGGNWSGGGVPAPNSNADIYNGGTATISQVGEVCNTLSLGNTAGSGTIQMNGGYLKVGNIGMGTVYVGYSGAGNFNQSGGTFNYNTYGDFVYLGYNPGSSGTYNLNGTGSFLSDFEYVGYSGTGTVTQSAGTSTISYGTYYGILALGDNPGSSGTYNLNGTGQLSAQIEDVGYNSAAGVVPTDRRRQYGRPAHHRQQRPLSLQRRHAPTQRRREQRRRFRRRQRRRHAHRQRHHRPLRQFAERRLDEREPRGRLAADRSRRIRSNHGLRQSQRRLFEHHPCGGDPARAAGRSGLRRLRLDQRSGELPRNDHRRRQRLDRT